MSGKRKWKRKVIFKGVKLNNNFVEDILQICMDEFSKIVDQDKSITFTTYFHGDDYDDTLDSDVFRKDLRNKHATGFRIWISAKSVDIDIHVQESTLEFEIRTKDFLDETWLTGLQTRLSNTFDTHKNIRSQLSTLVWWIISFILALGLSYSIAMWMITLQPYLTSIPDLHRISIAMYTLVGLMLSFIPMGFFFEWLFPRVEIDHMNRIKFRKFITGSLLVPIIVNIFTSIFF